MATEIKTLASGLLRKNTAAFTEGERILYAAPLTRTALITAIRLFNSSKTVPLNSISMLLVRYDVNKNPQDRTSVLLLPVNSVAIAGKLRVDTAPLVVEAGDLIVGYALEANTVQYVINGIERDQSA